MSKRLVFISLLLTASCADEGYDCGTLSTDVTKINVGDSIVGRAVYEEANPTIYEAGDYCNEGYQFSEYNPDAGDWCFYYTVDVDCATKKVTQVYKGKLFNKGEEL